MLPLHKRKTWFGVVVVVVVVVVVAVIVLIACDRITTYLESLYSITSLVLFSYPVFESTLIARLLGDRHGE